MAEQKELFCGIDVIETLGQGAYGTVSKGVYNGELVAIKLTKNQNIVDFGYTEVMDIDIPFRINHPNIIKGKELIVNESEDCHISLGEYVIVTELGNPYQKIFKDKLFYDIKHRLRHMTQLISGINALHKSNILHLDIKVENNVIVGEPINGNLKLIDFGLAVPLIHENDVFLTDSPRVTIIYRHPKLLRDIFYDKKSTLEFTTKDDIFAFGIIVFVIYGGRYFTMIDHRYNTLATGSVQFIKQYLSDYDFFLNDHLPQLIKSVSFRASDKIKNILSRILVSDYNKIPSTDEVYNVFISESQYIDTPVTQNDMIINFDLVDFDLMNELGFFFDLIFTRVVVKLDNVREDEVKFPCIDLIYRTVGLLEENFGELQKYYYLSAIILLIANIKYFLESIDVVDIVSDNAIQQASDNEIVTGIIEYQRSILNITGGKIINYSTIEKMKYLSNEKLFDVDTYRKYRE